MKNYLLFIVDSLNYSHVKASPVPLMPFCDSIAPESIVCDNMYSQAPYTEAAVMNLYCGQNVLDHGGYLRRFADAPQTLFEVMREAGYRTYYNSFQPQCYPSSLRRGVDDLYYNVGYDLGALWSYRLGHYAALHRRGALTAADYRMLEDILADNLAEWERFVQEYLDKAPAVEMIADNNHAYNAEAVLGEVREHRAQLAADPAGYINALLEQGTAHALFEIPAYVQDKKIGSKEAQREIARLFRPLLREIRRRDFRYNLKNNKGFSKGTFRCFGNMLAHPGKRSLKDFLKSAYFTVNVLRDLDLYQRMGEGSDTFKAAPSARTHIDHYLKWADAHRDEGHFACIHVDDVHNPEMFHTYDSEDSALLTRERDEARALIDALPKDYKGSITHDLSLRYIDGVIRYLFEQMQEKGLLQDTCVILTADHGFSFSANPVRDSFVVNLYLENYNIPCYIYNSGLPAARLDKLCTSKDIPATLCALATGNVPESFNGHSLLEAHTYPEVMIEYCGGGCPDLSRRELKIAAFNAHTFVGTLGTLENCSDESVSEIYDLEKDPLQLHNLAPEALHTDEARALLARINARKAEIAAALTT